LSRKQVKGSFAHIGPQSVRIVTYAAYLVDGVVQQLTAEVWPLVSNKA
jgi:hypothetical protein